MSYQLGDIINLQGRLKDNGRDISPLPSGIIPCIVTRVSEGDGRILEAKVLEPDERYGRMGFIEYNGDYYAVEWEICAN